ncbi:MAG: hypothetical protein NTW50_01135 [Candidatus Berkelbacteria bacterium]|nr:hypothetical protein [Candidatus Berkelbacteria bacterium]
MNFESDMGLGIETVPARPEAEEPSELAPTIENVTSALDNEIITPLLEIMSRERNQRNFDFDDLNNLFAKFKEKFLNLSNYDQNDPRVAAIGLYVRCIESIPDILRLIILIPRYFDDMSEDYNKTKDTEQRDTDIEKIHEATSLAAASQIRIAQMLGNTTILNTSANNIVSPLAGRFWNTVYNAATALSNTEMRETWLRSEVNSYRKGVIGLRVAINFFRLIKIPSFYPLIENDHVILGQAYQDAVMGIDLWAKNDKDQLVAIQLKTAWHHSDRGQIKAEQPYGFNLTEINDETIFSFPINERNKLQRTARTLEKMSKDTGVKIPFIYLTLDLDHTPPSSINLRTGKIIGDPFALDKEQQVFKYFKRSDQNEISNQSSNTSTPRFKIVQRGSERETSQV